jgi:glutamate/aspartate transport system substrate-binding protein
MPRKKMNMNVISAKDIGESYQMLEYGRAIAFMQDDALLAGEMAKAKKPEDWVVTGTPQSNEIYGCTMRRGDSALKKVVDAFSSRAKSTPSTINGLLSPTLPKA